MMEGVCVCVWGGGGGSNDVLGMTLYSRLY